MDEERDKRGDKREVERKKNKVIKEVGIRDD